jgi:hypothetical protein
MLIIWTAAGAVAAGAFVGALAAPAELAELLLLLLLPQAIARAATTRLPARRTSVDSLAIGSLPPTGKSVSFSYDSNLYEGCIFRPENLAGKLNLSRPDGKSLSYSRRRLLKIGASLGIVVANACASRIPRFNGSTLVPRIEEPWWTIAIAPDLGPLGQPDEIEVVDFTIWRAADSTWQLQACIRGTKVGGEGRLLYRWQGPALTATGWRPIGIALEADPPAGETPGGLQAPFVVKVGRFYRLFYGDWVNICQAISDPGDGKSFLRLLGPDGRSGMFDEGADANARDPMLLQTTGGFILYYTAHPDGKGAVYARTSADLATWSPSRVVAAGGEAGSGPFAAECPFVTYDALTGRYSLFRTQRYGAGAETRVYRSDNPLSFGVDDDRFLVATLPIAAPEIVVDSGESYIAALAPDLKGIRVARLQWDSGG